MVLAEQAEPAEKCISMLVVKEMNVLSQAVALEVEFSKPPALAIQAAHQLLTHQVHTLLLAALRELYLRWLPQPYSYRVGTWMQAVVTKGLHQHPTEWLASVPQVALLQEHRQTLGPLGKVA